jgi:hypothetical protein
VGESSATSVVAWIEEIRPSKLRVPRATGGTANSNTRMCARFAVVRLRVMLIGSPPAQTEIKVSGKAANQLGSLVDPWKSESAVGKATYVFYDPQNPGACEIDTDRLKDEFSQEKWWHPILIELTRDFDDNTLPPTARASYPQDSLKAPLSHLEQLGIDRPEPSESIADGLKSLTELHDRGDLTDTEFSDAKSRLINSDD